MKLFFISDIHGSAQALEKAIDKFYEKKADIIIFLGDAINHGPRNPLPEGYEPLKVAKILNSLSDKIVAVRGNCDSEVDQMLIDIPIMSDYHIVLLGNRKIFLTHGHIYSKDKHPKLNANDIFVSGHTHIPVLEKDNSIIYFNPGSISLPKGGFKASFGIMDDKIITIEDFDGNIINQITL